MAAASTAQQRQQLTGPLALTGDPHDERDYRWVQLKLCFDVSRAGTTPVDARRQYVELLEREVAGDRLCIGLTPPVPVVGNRARSAKSQSRPHQTSSVTNAARPHVRAQTEVTTVLLRR